MAKIVAEIGCNHKGDMDIAKELIQVAHFFCKADYVKFQKRNNKELLNTDEYNSAHPNPMNSFGDTYGAHREFLEFSVAQHKELKQYCKELGIGYSTSVWDVTSALEFSDFDCDFLKIPSACNLDFSLQETLIKNFKGDIHVSTGMTSKNEIEEIVSFYESHGAANRVVLYACTSGYPVAFEDVCLLEITKYKELFGKRVKEIAFSGHHLGIAIDVAAVTLGATWVERHYTLDRTWKGTDHSASLEPSGLRKLVRDVTATEKALSYKKSDILKVETVQRNKLKRLAKHFEHAQKIRSTTAN